MKMVVVSGTTTVNERKIAAGPEAIIVATGGESVLFLLKVPEIEDLTLQMEHEVNTKERS
jgi:hypothetical protein